MCNTQSVESKSGHFTVNTGAPLDETRTVEASQLENDEVIAIVYRAGMAKQYNHPGGEWDQGEFSAVMAYARCGTTVLNSTPCLVVGDCCHLQGRYGEAVLLPWRRMGSG
jgi:hypothetical protein